MAADSGGWMGGTAPGDPEPKLLQLRYRDDPWKCMVSCVLLNQTSRRQVDQVIDELFERWPDRAAMATADPAEIKPVIESLGFGNRRSETLVKLSKDAVAGKSADQWYGVGKYAWDSYLIFVFRAGTRREEVTDKELLRWQEWKRNNPEVAMGDG